MSKFLMMKMKGAIYVKSNLIKNPQVRKVLQDAHLWIRAGFIQPIVSILLLTKKRNLKMDLEEYKMNNEISTLINKGIMAYVGTFNEVGKHVTDIYSSEDVYQVDVEPKKLLDKVLNYYGANYKGAIASSKSILGPVDMAPISIGGPNGYILFTSMSPSIPECTFFFLHHIRSYHTIDSKTTAVVLSNGEILHVPVSRRSFQSRYHKALELKEKMASRSLYHIPYDMGEHYQAVSDKTVFYRVKKQSD